MDEILTMLYVIGYVLSICLNVVALYKLIIGKASKKFIKRTRKVLEYIRKTREGENIAEFVELALDVLTNVGLTGNQVDEIRSSIRRVVR